MINAGEANPDLPEGWINARLAEIATINPRHPKGLDESQLVTFVPMAALSECKPQFQYSEERPLELVRRGFTHFAEGDVLIAKITPCLENGKAAIARDLLNGLGCGTTELHVIRPLGGISPDYVYQFLHQERVRSDAAATFSGTAGQLRVPASFISDLQIPLPPLAEQKRIVARVEVLLGWTQAVRERLSRLLTLLKSLRQSILAAACDGRLTADWRRRQSDSDQALSDREPLDDMPPLPVTWRYERAADIVEPESVITYGIVLPGPNRIEGVPYIRGQDIDDAGQIHVNQLWKTSEAVASKHNRSALRAGDVLLCVIRHLRVAIVPPGLDGANLTQGTVRLRPSKCISDGFLARFLSSRQAQAWMKTRYIGMAMPRINVAHARAIPIAVPPLDEQNEIVRRVEVLFKLIDSIECRVMAATTRADTLTQVILAKAFRGDLVPTEADLASSEGRNYEPASLLLERIRFGRIEPANRVRRQSATTLPARVEASRIEKGRAVLDILLLLKTWDKPVSMLALEPALVLMRNNVARETLLTGKYVQRKRKELAKPPQFITGLDLIYEGLVRSKAIRRVGEHAFELANPTLLAQVSKADRAKAVEVVKAAEALGDLRQLPAVVAELSHESYEVAV